MVEDSPPPYWTTQSEVLGVLVYTRQCSTGQAEAGELPFKASLGYTVRNLNKTITSAGRSEPAGEGPDDGGQTLELLVLNHLRLASERRSWDVLSYGLCPKPGEDPGRSDVRWGWG